jgi:hypothetical protein
MRGGRGVAELVAIGLGILGRAALEVATGLGEAVGEAVGESADDTDAGGGGRGNVEGDTKGATEGEAREVGEEDEEDEDSGLHPVRSSSGQDKSPRNPNRLIM